MIPPAKLSLTEAKVWVRQHARHILGLALLALFVQDIFGAGGFLAMRRTQKQIHSVRQQISKLNKENKSLADQVQALKTDPQAIERVAREKMGLARPGELIYRMPERSQGADPQPTTPQQ